MESQCWSENFFVTLTYDDVNLPVISDYSTGEYMAATLVPFDVSGFMKRLREYYRSEHNHVGIRFYLGAEYGDTSARPHYHLLVFNCPIFDLEYYAKSPLGDVYFNSQTFANLWQKGHVVIGELTSESAAYTARYCQKKATKDVDYDALGIHKEYTRMSNRPGIGYPYFEKYYEQIYAQDQIYLPNGHIITPPRFFDDKAAKLGYDIEKIKNERFLNAIVQNNEVVKMVSRDYYDQLEDLEKEFCKRSKILCRPLS